MKPKYDIGQVVVTDDNEACTVLSYSYDGDQFSYRLSSKDVDVRNRKMVEGVKNVLESEIKPLETE